ncbi:carbohydrate sulfotransferase 6 [Microcaecilia unicolor]|uniref:Sulfotransferase n=1 Tax=Microcaecilia unicolor TaxID=1415580 RepID=A0A6P7XCP9_9AMPH|nr:carbohydrate sulfotransferase 6-like [Microcaecilia unicolor]
MWLRRKQLKIFLLISASGLILFFAFRDSTKSHPVFAKTQLLILSTWRSGSTFFGELFNCSPEVFYLMEPTRHVWASLSKQPFRLLQIPMRNLLRSIFQCDMSALEPYLNKNPSISDLFMWYKNRALCSLPVCSAFGPFDINEEKRCRLECQNSDFKLIEETCKSYKHIVIKVVRFQDLKALYSLLQDPSLNLKIIHLVRDPRAVLNSREHVNGLELDDMIVSESQNANLGMVMSRVCRSQANIYQTAMQNPPPFLKDRYLLVRYEDLAQDLLPQISKWYAFAGIRVSPELESFINNLTRVKKLAGAWRTKLSFSKVQEVQRLCKTTMELFGYRFLESEQQQKDLATNVVLPMPHQYESESSDIPHPQRH